MQIVGAEAAGEILSFACCQHTVCVKLSKTRLDGAYIFGFLLMICERAVDGNKRHPREQVGDVVLQHSATFKPRGCVCCVGRHLD